MALHLRAVFDCMFVKAVAGAIQFGRGDFTFQNFYGRYRVHFDTFSFPQIQNQDLGEGRDGG